MSDEMHAQASPPADPAKDHPHGLKIGRELLRGCGPDGDLVTFVCYDDGYALRRDGRAVPDGRWDADAVDDALAAFRRLTRLTMLRPLAPPAA